ncbi:ROK family transcriptional regulator [Brachybacterium sp. YJGR34]|uniref:ROK family transcriptional regulator n=1 Tax=Brachybacterium sp. YJGR34 TaxID=2059911 RepID=UPI0018E61FD8|nr:ROK family transcriptional regulator [Brachybacterium sp. YJGR34]
MAGTGPRRASATDAAVLETVRRRGETTRVDLARELGVTAATVTYSVKRLMAAGLLAENGFARSTGGKRASLLRLVDEARWAIGCTVDADRISLVGVDMTGALRSRAVLPLAPGADAAAITATIGEALARMEPDRNRHSATEVGMAIPQGADAATTDLLEEVRAALPFPTVSAGSTVCAALGSFWSGEQPERGLTATVHLDTGAGIALLADGEPLPTSPRATLDHACVDPAGPPCPCGARGCLQLYASPRAIVRAAHDAGDLADRLGLDPAARSEGADAVVVALAAARGDDGAQAILDTALRALAQVSGTVIAGLGIGTVVFSGAFLQAAPGLARTTLEEQLTARATGAGPDLSVLISQIQPHPGSVGAAVLALRRLMDTGSAAAG